MNNINKINKLKEEIKNYKNEIVEFTRLKNDYISGKRSMRLDFPAWRHMFHRTPMDWIDWQIMTATNAIERCEEKIREIYKKDVEWFEVGYYRQLDEDDIKDIINSDGFIIGFKI